MVGHRLARMDAASQNNRLLLAMIGDEVGKPLVKALKLRVDLKQLTLVLLEEQQLILILTSKYSINFIFFSAAQEGAAVFPGDFKVQLIHCPELRVPSILKLLVPT